MTYTSAWSRSAIVRTLTCGAFAAFVALIGTLFVAPQAAAAQLGDPIEVTPLGEPAAIAPLGEPVRVAPERAGADPAADALPRGPEVSPEEAGFDAARFLRVDSVIRHALEDGASPGAALVVGRHGKLVRLRGYGHTDWGPFAPEVTDSTLYDLASLTKAMGTATVAIQMASEGRLMLDAPIHRYLPDWPSRGFHGEITSRHLLAHTSGLPAGADLWPGWRSRSEIIASLGELEVWSKPGTRREYSDVGMILLGAVLEEVSGSRLDNLLQSRVFRPLELHDTRFNPLTAHGEYGGFALAQIAPTEYDTYVRNTLVHGVVHDLNAWAMDGVAGHAGLFSSARDMAVYGQAILDAAHGRDNPLFETGTFLTWLRNERVSGRPLGWDAPDGHRSSAGLYFTQSSFGHTGFTGTSIWVDPVRDVFVVLLTNRLNPSARNRRHVQLRRDVHDYVQLAIADMSVEARE
ncbi:MAG TPA: serine hydrolase domain-containing protein [Longimicrobiales bacterium]|nr:serine hydrolase domain-containing protein [Longimicrobiales bacterium]